MVIRSHEGTEELGRALRSRRVELGLTIEEIARAAGVGSETWRRYEAGASIRADKVGGVCRALRWRALPRSASGDDPSADEDWLSFPKDKYDDSYSEWLEHEFGKACAHAFASGCDIIRDQITDDLGRLASRPRGTHIGELGGWLDGLLPTRWVPRYDYEFVFQLRCAVETVRLRVVHPDRFDHLPVTLTVAEDLALHLILETGSGSAEMAGSSGAADWDEWEYELNGEDDEVIPVLYSEDIPVPPGSRFHFDRWFEVTHYGYTADAEGNLIQPTVEKADDEPR